MILFDLKICACVERCTGSARRDCAHKIIIGQTNKINVSNEYGFRLIVMHVHEDTQRNNNVVEHKAVDDDTYIAVPLSKFCLISAVYGS